MTRIWTDGCCLVNPGGAGGWAFVVEADGEVISEEWGSEPETTNNRMELMAVIEALPWAEGRRVRIVSDSKYVVDGATGWVHTWKAHGWKRPTRRGFRAVKNVELWKVLDGLLYPTPGGAHGDAIPVAKLEWVKGHDGAVFNERADLLAERAAANALPADPDPDPADEFVERFGWSPG
ncbi:MAG TPA: ribonuclease H [Solirubrobacterales bacterium]|nr:ribonuclease H [Solirubrobacterales bacterium]